MNLQIGFLIIFSVIGLFVSTACGIFVGNGLGRIVVVSLLSTLVMAGFGFGLHMFLQSKVPEFLDFLSNIGGSYSGSSTASSNSEESGFSKDLGSDTDSSESGFASARGEGEARAAAAGIPRRKAEKFGDHIMVENIAIKNEPKLMAEAIRTMLAKDEMSQEK
ncbi:hypothetical protein CH373_09550 [Leptospira perolatii]|uniref:Uncharacterized protein n=1 Tax=Leptospira perolatii TaxID=2023191 RepID=A0A2M9ZMB0_9LEPT|nr:hypothetical protein [Leptospira perolatii]PJZ70034.1 hypothetical protein CH360_07295 [Leptospira perolatii]PJZ73222.1 hypothetical protein CH373_09550 [Leptospira perolatii]